MEYLKELITHNEQLTATAKLAEKSANALQVLQNQITVLDKENAFLRSQMIQLGIENTAGALNSRSLLSNPLAQSLLGTQPAAPTIPNTTQLLVSLAQTLSANPLLVSLAQNTAALQAAAVAAATNSPVSASANSLTTTTQVSPSFQAQLSSSSNTNQVVNSLVQTLASIANTNTTPSQPPISSATQPPAVTLTAAASLINSLIMAQSALTTTSTSPSNAVDSPSHSITGSGAPSLPTVLSAVAEATKTPTK